MESKIRNMILPDGWYPHNKVLCEKEIEDYLSNTYTNEIDKSLSYKGCIVPHAGWTFSGKLAANTIALLKSTNPDLVVIYGGHSADGYPVVYYEEEAWETPFGNLKIEKDITNNIIELLKNEIKFTKEFANDNTIEILLPIIKYFFPKTTILPLRLMPNDDAILIGEKISNLIQKNNLNTIYIASTDLTHYGFNYGFSPKGISNSAIKWVKEVNDKGFIDLCLSKDAKGLLEYANNNNSACSSGAVAGLLSSLEAYKKDFDSVLVEYHTSYDIIPGDSFVGYAGISYYFKD